MYYKLKRALTEEEFNEYSILHMKSINNSTGGMRKLTRITINPQIKDYLLNNNLPFIFASYHGPDKLHLGLDTRFDTYNSPVFALVIPKEHFEECPDTNKSSLQFKKLAFILLILSLIATELFLNYSYDYTVIPFLVLGFLVGVLIILGIDEHLYPSYEPEGESYSSFPF